MNFADACGGRVQRLAELRMIPPDERARQYLMALIAAPNNAFFDESGTHDQSDMVAVGGIVGSYEAFARAEMEWGRVLRKRDLKFFHFTDFMAGHPPYDWPTTERDNFIERLATIISETATLGIAYGIFKSDYQELRASLRKEFRDIYYCCCFSCLDSLAKWESRMNGPILPKPLEFLFDRKPKWEGYATRIYYEVVRDIADDASALGNMGFGNKEVDVPLQMADLVVGAAIRHFKRQKVHGSDVKPDRLIARLGAKGRMFLIWLDKELLLKMNVAPGVAPVP